MSVNGAGPVCRSPREVARYLRVSLKKVLAWIHSGRLRALDVGEGGKARYRVRPEDLDDFAAGRAAARPETQRRRAVKRPAGWVERY